MGKFVVVGDREQMFHPIKVREVERDALRFIWRKLPDSDISDYQMTLYLFGKVDSPCCANFALKKSAVDKSDTLHPSVVKTIDQDFYMDDFLKSHSSAEHLIDTTNTVISTLKQAGFRLTKLVSNSHDIINKLPSTEIIDQTKISQPDSNQRILGILWDIQNNILKLRPVSNIYPNTKRGILSLLSSIFDPLGIVAPVLLEAKLIVQELWRQKISWYQDIPSDLEIRFKKWKSKINLLNNITLPRFHGFDNSSENEIHIFADASSLAYGAAAYFRILSSPNIKVFFIMGKSCLAPLNEKSLTIPKLELQAAVTASRLKVKMLEEIDLNIHRIYFWIDSKTVLKYIRNENKRFPVYIMHRVSEIRLNSDINDWHFISGSINVSDHCTRPLSFEDLVKQNDYLYGPKILFQPLENVLSTDDKHIILEHQVEQNSIDISNKHTTMNNPVLPYQHYSSWQKLVRHIAYIKLLTRNWKNKKDNCESIPLVLTREILDEARETILIVVQKETFTSEYQCLKSNSPLKIRSKLLQLSPILVNNLIKVGGRLTHSNLPQYHKYQTILPANHHVTTLIINHFHENYHHCGRDQTLAVIREQFWIINGKSIVKKSLNKCIPCRKQKITPQPQFMSDLPEERLAYNEPAFSFTGTDYFGPLIVKQSKKTRQNLGQCKRYGVVFTCLTTRALHLELAGDLSTDSFILALRRFIARRGQPNTIWSDNGTNYVGAERELRTLLAKLNQNKISSTLINKNIIWKFNPPSSPWMGGYWVYCKNY